MGLVNMNLLNYLWETGIKPIKNAIAEKLDSSKAANNLLTTEEGFYLDARQGPEIMSMIEEQNSNLSELSGSLSNLFTAATGSTQYSVAAYGATAIHIYPEIPSGYVAIGIAGFNTGSTNVLPFIVSNNRIDVQNVGGSAITSMATITVLCVKRL